MLMKSIRLMPGLAAIFSVAICFAGDNNNPKEITKLEQSAESIEEKSIAPVKEISVQPIKDKSPVSVEEEVSGSIKKNVFASIKEKWGMDEFSVHQTSAGYMLDIRYRVTDAIKAKPLFSRKLHPFVIDEASGIRYGVPASPKVGFLRQAPSYLKENKVYFMFVANPGKRIKKGDKLTLVIGDFRVEHLTVE